MNKYFPYFLLMPIMSVLCALQIFGYSKDYYTYLGAFMFYDDWSYYVWIEPSFILFSKIFNPHPFGFYIYLFLSTFIALSIKLHIIKKIFPNYLPVILFYICTIFFLHEYTQVRVSTAIAFFYLAYFSSYTSRSMKMFYLVVAVCFHYSILILICLYLLTKIRLTRRRVLLSILVSFVLSFSSDVFLLEILGSISRLNAYTDKQGTLWSLVSFGKFILYIPYVMHFFIRSDMNSKDFKLLHWVIFTCILTANLHEVLSTRIAGLGYFLAVLVLFNLRVAASRGEKNMMYLFASASGVIIFSLVLL